METIPKADCEKVGFFRKTHGVQGELVLEFEPHFEYSVEDATRYFVEIDGLLVPFFLAEDGFRFKTANTAILTFDGVESEKYAKRLVGASVYLFSEEIVPMNDEPELSRFIDYTVFDSKTGEIGRVEHIDDFSGNIVLTVIYKGEELLIPFNEDFLINIDESSKTIELSLPEGLIEM